MSRYIIKLGDLYGEWSTVIDAPVTILMPLDEFRAYYRDQYGEHAMGEYEYRMQRVNAKGTSSCHHESGDDVMCFNHFGRNGEQLSLEQVKTEWQRVSSKGG